MLNTQFIKSKTQSLFEKKKKFNPFTTFTLHFNQNNLLSVCFNWKQGVASVSL